MATYTSHLNLKLPDYSDTADIKDLNDNFKKIDDAIASGGTGGGTGGGIVTETDPTVPSWAKQPSKPTYTAGEVGARPDTWMPSASEVGADASGTAAAQVGAHNVSGEAHADLYALIEGLTSRLNALADSDDTTLDQLSEIVAYIKSNKSLIDAVTTGKVSVSDIVDNLTTNASGKVLSAAQGVALKAMIDGIVIPTALPNPQPITINGQRYDGSEAVTVTPVEIDDTLTQSGKAADAKAVGDQLSALNAANATQDAEIAKKANDSDLAKVAKSGSYTDLTNKPTIPTVPTMLPNPNKLTFTGAVTAEYDGSSEVSVEIPAGGSGGYTLPIASATQLGGVKPAAKTDEMTQAVGVDEAGGLWAQPGSGDGGWTLKETIDVGAGTSAIKINFDTPPREVLIDGRITATKNGNLYVVGNYEHLDYGTTHFACVTNGINTSGSRRFTVLIEKIKNGRWMVRFNAPIEGSVGTNQLVNWIYAGQGVSDINYIYLATNSTELSINGGDINVFTRR